MNCLSAKKKRGQKGVPAEFVGVWPLSASSALCGAPFFFFDGVKCIDAHTSEKGANTQRSPQLPKRGALLPTRNTVPGSPPGRAESVEERVFSRHGSKFREKRVPDSLCTSTVLGSVCHRSCLHRFGMHTRRPVQIE